MKNADGQNQTKKQYDFYKGLRVLALTALLCTVTLTIAIWIESVTPGHKSYSQTVMVESGIKTAFEISESDDITPVGIRLRISDPAKKHYRGDTAVTTVELPSSSIEKIGFTYSSSNPNLATIDENGKITYVGNSSGKVTFTAVSKSNKDISDSVSVTVHGINPATAENPLIVFPDTVFEGSVTGLKITTDNYPLYLRGMSIASDNEIIKFSSDYKKVYAIGAGTATITATAGDTVLTKTVTVTAGEYSVPTSFSTAEPSLNLLIKSNKKLTVNPVPSDSAPLFSIQSDNPNVAKVYGDTVYVVGVGNCTITVTSLFDSSVTLTIPTTVSPVVPANIAISGEDRVLKNYSYRYSAFLSPEPTDGSVVWSVVSGKCVIDKEGNIYPTKLGKVVIRATSVANPSVYAEKEITVSLFDTFYMFVRKIIGHFSLFAVLGFGLAFTTLFLIRPRWLAPIVALISGFVAAGISEMLQLPAFTTGRYSTWTDVWIDTLGVVCGMAVAAIIIAIICLLWRKLKREDYIRMKNDFSLLSYKTVFKKDKPQS